MDPEGAGMCTGGGGQRAHVLAAGHGPARLCSCAETVCLLPTAATCWLPYYRNDRSRSVTNDSLD